MAGLFEIDTHQRHLDLQLARVLAARALRLALDDPAATGQQGIDKDVRTLVACAGHRSGPLALAIQLLHPVGRADRSDSDVVVAAVGMLRAAQQAIRSSEPHAA